MSASALRRRFRRGRRAMEIGELYSGATGLWHDFSILSRLKQVSDGTTDVASHTDPVGWARSGDPAERLAVMATSGRRPTWRTGNVLLFDGTDDYLLSAGTTTLTGTLAVRAKYTTANKIVLGAKESGSGHGRVFLGCNSSGYAAGGVGQNSLSVVAGAVDIRDTWVTHVLKWDGATVTMKVNNAIVYQAAQSGAVTAGVAIAIGALNADGTPSSYFAGELRHALALSRPTTDPEDTRIHQLWSL